MLSKLGKHFDIIRINNLKHILKLLRNKESATKAELAELSGLSFPTAGSLLTELIQTGEVISLQFDSSTGGRPAERFKINPLNTLLLTVFIEAGNVISRVYDSSSKKIDEKKN